MTRPLRRFSPMKRSSLSIRTYLNLGVMVRSWRLEKKTESIMTQAEIERACSEGGRARRVVEEGFSSHSLPRSPSIVASLITESPSPSYIGLSG